MPSGSGSTSGDAPPSRKRTKVQASVNHGPEEQEQEQEQEEEEEEETRRTRGRPRLDTKDETAADRRRTQIRLAQRAYRNRKENTIQTLERKVQDLKDTNEEMSNAFMKLHDFAVSQGLLDRAPDFGHQLQATTQVFLSLARQSSEGTSKEGDQADSPAHEPGTKNRRPQPQAAVVSQQLSPDLPESRRGNEPDLLYSGIVMDNGPSMEPGAIQDSVMPSTRYHPATSAVGYDLSRAPATPHASFQLDQPATTAPTHPFMPSPYPVLASPHSLASHEHTFGRRLQRSCLERALMLVNAANPPKAHYDRVFGFCMLFETKDMIRRRLTMTLNNDSRHSLAYWQYPFLHLAGNGTFLAGMDGNMSKQRPADPDAQLPSMSPVGNQGLEAPLRPSYESPYSMGPFSSQVSAARDNHLGMDNKITAVPGFDGEFYDCDEVEMYLRQRGISIPGSADFLSVEVDPQTLDDSSAADAAAYMFSGGSETVSTATSEKTVPSLHPTDSSPSASGSSSSGSVSHAALMSDGNLPNTIHMTMAGDSFPPSLATTFAGYPAISAPYEAPNNYPMGAFSSFSVEEAPRTPPRKLVTLNVGAFVGELISRGVCLGRSPGFKPKDVNTAFWRAVQDI